jgi:hypothetical protein
MSAKSLIDALSLAMVAQEELKTAWLADKQDMLHQLIAARKDCLKAKKKLGELARASSKCGGCSGVAGKVLQQFGASDDDETTP